MPTIRQVDSRRIAAHFSLVLVEDGKRAQLVETDAGAVATGTVNPVNIH